MEKTTLLIALNLLLQLFETLTPSTFFPVLFSDMYLYTSQLIDCLTVRLAAFILSKNLLTKVKISWPIFGKVSIASEFWTCRSFLKWSSICHLACSNTCVGIYWLWIWSAYNGFPVKSFAILHTNSQAHFSHGSHEKVGDKKWKKVIKVTFVICHLLLGALNEMLSAISCSSSLAFVTFLYTQHWKLLHFVSIQAWKMIWRVSSLLTSKADLAKSFLIERKLTNLS